MSKETEAAPLHLLGAFATDPALAIQTFRDTISARQAALVAHGRVA